MSDSDNVFEYFQRAAGQEPEAKKPADSFVDALEKHEDEEPYELPPLRPEKYQAFRLGKRRERLHIARATQPFRFPAYHELKDINFDQDFQEGFNLFYHGMTVVVMGENLWPVVHAIASSRCDAIYEYHSKLYPTPPAKGEPFIKSIRIEPPAVLADG